ncbi:MAG TPA: IclR family transcriptional regulator C-terminal domain-containing protein, partial [Pusillimonas sp.]|uniref:IclR family transcriptional regulator domain-containing protein n=1 Tax=Pusillimonas sp. TaxID=3040095 RepID=UPI002CB5DBFD
GNEIVYVVRVPAHRIMSINLGVGSRLPADCTAMGRVLLAGLPDDVLQQRIQDMHLTAYTPHTIVDRQALLEEIQQVRIQGWSLVSEELEPGLVSVAAPIRGPNGRVVAALNVSGHARAITSEQLLKACVPRLLAAAAKINMLTSAR